MDLLVQSDGMRDSDGLAEYLPRLAILVLRPKCHCKQDECLDTRDIRQGYKVPVEAVRRCEVAGACSVQAARHFIYAYADDGIDDGKVCYAGRGHVCVEGLRVPTLQVEHMVELGL